jgi:hypothetical protein
MPTPKQMEKLALEATRRQAAPPQAPDADPATRCRTLYGTRCWPILARPADLGCRSSNAGSRKSRATFCVSSACAACASSKSRRRTRSGSMGQHAIRKDVGQRLLDQTCTNRTGRHEEDGCWPDWIRLAEPLGDCEEKPPSSGVRAICSFKLYSADC